MRPSTLFIVATLTLAAQASWFSGSGNNEPTYNSWNTDELKAWLEVNNVPLPQHTSEAELRKAVKSNWFSASAWTRDQYYAAQKSFVDLRVTTFDTWDESRLRQFLLEQGVIAPKGPREYLVILARQKYRAYSSAASSYASQASATASTAVYGDKNYQASKSLSSMTSRVTVAIAQATTEAAKKFDELKDYVYSDWDEKQMRKWLEQRSFLKSKEKKQRNELLQMMHNAWGKVSSPIWDAWSDSYIHNWLVQHHIIKSDYESKRDYLVKQMGKYYYTTTESIYDKWSDSELKEWLVGHDVIKSDAQVSRDKMLKLIRDNYSSAHDTFWQAWSDSQIRNWLVDNGYLRSDAQLKRDELVKLANEKWHDVGAKSAAYLTWPDARLRCYLREHGIDEGHLPTDRPGLLQETRIRWLQTRTRADALYGKIKDVVNSGIFKTEDTLSHLFALLSGGWEDTKDKSADGYEKTKSKVGEGRAYADEKAGEASSWAEERVDDVKKSTGEKVHEAREAAGEKVKVGGQKLKGEL